MHDDHTPSPWMTRHVGLVPAKLTLLDVACGHGRHAKQFARRGVLVTAVDIDGAALASLRGFAGINAERRDLENYPWPYAPESFDCILVCNYLFRPNTEAMLASLKPGGLLLYETFMSGQERFGKPSRPEHLLRPNELMQWVHGSFNAFAYEQQPERDADGKPIAAKQKIAAYKFAKQAPVELSADAQALASATETPAQE